MRFQVKDDFSKALPVDVFAIRAQNCGSKCKEDARLDRGSSPRPQDVMRDGVGIDEWHAMFDQDTRDGRLP